MIHSITVLFFRNDAVAQEALSLMLDKLLDVPAVDMAVPIPAREAIEEIPWSRDVLDGPVCLTLTDKTHVLDVRQTNWTLMKRKVDFVHLLAGQAETGRVELAEVCRNETLDLGRNIE